MIQKTSENTEGRLFGIGDRIEATLQPLSTNVDVVDLERALGYLVLIMLSEFGFLILLVKPKS